MAESSLRPKVSLDLWKITTALSAPQVLSVVYVVRLITGVVDELAIVIGWGLVFDPGGAAADVAWIVRRLTWPAGTKVVVGDDEGNYVAFPKDSSKFHRIFSIRSDCPRDTSHRSELAPWMQQRQSSLSG